MKNVGPSILYETLNTYRKLYNLLVKINLMAIRLKTVGKIYINGIF